MGSRYKTVAVIAALLGLVACQQPAGKSAEPAAPQAQAAGDAATPAAATVSANIPAECQAYLNTMQTCIEHLSQANPAVAAQFRAQMDQTRARWASMENMATMGPACQTASNVLQRSLHSMGC